MTSIEVVVTPDGDTQMVFDDRLDLRDVGLMAIHRGSHVEPADCGQWTAELSPVGGPTLGPFDRRGEALVAEVAWLQKNWLIQITD
jgi:hypothetical protein